MKNESLGGPVLRIVAFSFEKRARSIVHVRRRIGTPANDEFRAPIGRLVAVNRNRTHPRRTRMRPLIFHSIILDAISFKARFQSRAPKAPADFAGLCVRRAENLTRAHDRSSARNSPPSIEYNGVMWIFHVFPFPLVYLSFKSHDSADFRAPPSTIIELKELKESRRKCHPDARFPSLTPLPPP